MDERPVTDISKDDLVGEWWIEPVDGESMNWLEATSKAIDGLRPLLIKPFTNTITGYYVSRKKISESLSVVRFFPFVKEGQSEQVSEQINTFIRQSSDVKHGQKLCHPYAQPLALEYGGETVEERFRRFLGLNTYISLDVMKGDIELARRLAITAYYWVHFADKDYKNHFEPSFIEHSPTYKSLSDEQKMNFWDDFGEEPENATYWAHFYENLAYGFLWIPRQIKMNHKYSIEEINQFFQSDYKLPPDWTPPS